jgi:hypothetical protein
MSYSDDVMRSLTYRLRDLYDNLYVLKDLTTVIKLDIELRQKELALREKELGIKMYELGLKDDFKLGSSELPHNYQKKR